MSDRRQDEDCPATGSAAKVRVCVIASYWTGHPVSNIVALSRSLQRHPAGYPFDLVVVCNGGDQVPLAPEILALPARVINRPNGGYNLGAWNAGWQAAPDYDLYLFLQDECRVRMAGWLAAFVNRMAHDPGLGLLGESLVWDRLGWDFIAYDTARTLPPGYIPISHFLEYMSAHDIPPGPDGSHLQSLIWCTHGAVLTRSGGLPHADQYADAVACEIGFSKIVEAQGLRIAQISSHSFRYVTHAQWTGLGPLKTRVRKAKGRLKGRLKAALGR